MFKKFTTVLFFSLLPTVFLMGYDGRLQFVVNSSQAQNLQTPTRNDHFAKYAKDYKINKTYLKAICKYENPRQDPKLVSKPNKNGSRDYGLCQVNERTAKEICEINDPKELLNEETNIWCATRIAREKINQFKLSKLKDDNVVRRYNGYAQTASNQYYTRDVLNIWTTIVE